MNERLQQEYANVRESWMLYDTVAVSLAPPYGTPDYPNGWFPNWLTMGAATEISFFNVRNRRIGLSYNNQDARDQIPYAFRARSIGISFWATPITEFEGLPSAGNCLPEDCTHHVFTHDLPRHASLTFQVAQDEILKTTALMAPGGYGPVGGGYMRGQPSSYFDQGFDVALGVATQGESRLTNRWVFPVPIDIPRNASLSAKIRFSEYGRQLLQAFPQQNPWYAGGLGGDSNESGEIQMPVSAGIQISLIGDRLVQQRGQYHV